MTCGLTTRFVVVLGLTLAGCTLDPNPGVYCDGTSAHKCTEPAFPYCDVAIKRCVANADAGMGDLGGDASMCNGGNCPMDMKTRDLTPPVDLDPYCSVADVASACTTTAAPICNTSLPVAMCAACRNSGDDAQCVSQGKTVCLTEGTNKGQCGQCRPANNTAAASPGPDSCPSASPVCDVTGSCRACQANNECPSQVCNFNGTCASVGTVVYAANANPACSDTAHISTPAAPYCQIQAALTNLGSNTVISVAASATAYSALSINSGTVTISGPPPSPATCTAGGCATITGGASPAISIGGASTVVTLDGLEVDGTFAGQDGLSCSNGSVGPTVTVLRSYFHNLAGIAINSSNKCKITLDRDWIGPANAGGGISLTQSQYSITNTFVIDNVSTTAPGVSFNTGTTALASGLGFAHNTVAGNGLGAVSAGGITCPAGTSIAITDSIVLGNTKAGTGAAATQLAGMCSLSYTDIDDGTTPVGGGGNRNLPADFVSTVLASPDYHLAGRTTNNLACCINQIPSPDPVNHDYDGRSRPQPTGGNYGIGAHEVPSP